jgi:hypothetical protein
MLVDMHPELICLSDEWMQCLVRFIRFEMDHANLVPRVLIRVVIRSWLPAKLTVYWHGLGYTPLAVVSRARRNLPTRINHCYR